VLFDYHNSSIRTRRLENGTDHCASGGKRFALHDLMEGLRQPANSVADQLVADGGRHKYIYAVSEDQQVNVAVDGIRGTPDAVKHESLFRNAPVLAAGELIITQGVVTHVNDHSGSYRTSNAMNDDPSYAAVVLASFEAEGVSFTAEERERLRALAER
jgi:hypothetical protein